MTTLKFVNSHLEELPIDKSNDSSPRQVKDAFFTKVSPTSVINPKIVCSSEDILKIIDLDKDDPALVEYFSGNKLFPGSDPVAHCYCGHQFGVFAGQLGDGRAILLGEIQNSKGEAYELQLKGSGKTPFSRDGDGRAVLRSSIREFLCSEAMFHLGIPTTRAGYLVTSQTLVTRDIKYDGNKTIEPATVVLRIAPSFLRFGSFQICDQGGPSQGNPTLIKTLTRYVVKKFFPHLLNAEEVVFEFANEVMRRTVSMVVDWQACGFTHGVLNTDNMSIFGLTIDYGPFGFMDAYNPNFVPNHSDSTGRYKFRNQPGVCKWNLERLFDSLKLAYPKLDLDDLLEDYNELYSTLYLDKMRKKLGLFRKIVGDADLIKDLLKVMETTQADYTNTLRHLSRFDLKSENKSVLAYILKQLKNPSTEETKTAWMGWLEKYRVRLEKEIEPMEKRVAMMNLNNPKYILRNYMAQLAIQKAEQGDYSEVKKLLEVLRDPYDLTSNPEHVMYDQLPPDWAGSLCISCSS